MKMAKTPIRSYFMFYNIIKLAGSLACGGLGVLFLGFLFPYNYSMTFAEEAIQASSNSTIALAIKQPDDININPTANGEFDSTSAELSISTSSRAGYKIYVNTLDASTDMINVFNEKATAIRSIPVASTSENFSLNTWGYALTTGPVDEGTIYQPIPENTTLAYDSKTTTSNTHYLTFGAKINTGLPAGQYTNQLMISAVANPQTITELTDATYMQELSSTVCNNTNGADGSATVTPGNEVTKQLIDIRDGKEYWVAKLADNNCWMTQNLALDLSTSKPLSDVDTDLNSRASWTVPANTMTNVPDGSSIIKNDSTSYSWNLGEYVLATPTRGTSCNSAPTGSSSNNDGYNSLRPGQTIEQNCTDFINVAKNNWQATFDSASTPEGIWSGTNYNSTTGKMETYSYTGPLAVDKNTKTYDAHYLIGNYYQFNAAAAGSGGEKIYSPENSSHIWDNLVNTADSICPRGWTLPKAGTNTLSGIPFSLDDSFFQLFQAYGYPGGDGYIVSGGSIGYVNILNEIYTGSATTPAHQNPALSALYLVNAGQLDLGTNTLRLAGFYGTLWSSTTYTTAASAWHLRISAPTIRPSTNNNRRTGYPIRCLVK